MAKVIFGAWDGNVIDNRNRKIYEIEEDPAFRDFDEFNPGNPIKAFFGGHGFFIFEKDVDLLDAALQHMERVARESCGKCTPCRVGTQIIKSKLEAMAAGQVAAPALDEIETIAEHIQSTSMCGLGQTATVALLEMIRYFREELLHQMENRNGAARQPGATYLSAPCIEACPSRVDVPRYIDYIKDGKFTHSLGVILQKYPMAATCGRVCVRFCEMACRRTQVDEAVGIKVLKRFVADHEKYTTNDWFSAYSVPEKKPDDLKVAVIGAGPAGISAAYHLLLKGYPVDVFEARAVPGGMAATGIPEYRLPKEVLRKETGIIETLGGKIFYGRKMGRDFTLKSLYADGYQAIFLGVGTHKGKAMGAIGEDPKLKGYAFGVDLLLKINHDYIDRGIPMELGEKMVVVGGGNVAMDCVRSALRMGVREVHLVYRRSRNEMPADQEEVEGAEKEGVIFHFLTHPTRIISENGRVKGLELIKMELGEPDKSGRRSVTPMQGSEFTLETDAVVPAIGQQVEHGFLLPEDDVDFNKWGMIDVKEDALMTTRKGVFAGGDCVTGPATLIQAMAQGERGAEGIDNYLTHGRIRFNPDLRMSRLVHAIQPMIKKGVSIPIKHEYRVKVRELDPEIRKRIFEEVEEPISVDEAYHEASRCMRCYRVYSVITEQ
ncbi:formate dehydrogenase beta subunit [Desulfosalsimonas propionicica]|uniref:Formate dehydrogenase beta subunit n=1 Tax=Desulfosalsimonas propionicica TaxID=332175 RepID=A0A7W0CAP0_9BACT|nr:FAD-dependent oxidoreductase [Desulfosalsimonas propionicica]MBA2882270.1 formate dehydrogenase beta subunit [Desulfosalsimonas propionicica]